MPEETLLNQLLTLERGALDRWMEFDPAAYLALYTSDATYFDPLTETRVDGMATLEPWLGQLRALKGTASDLHYEIKNPKVQRFGDLALLTFNTFTFGKPTGKAEELQASWNVTEAYARVNGQWRIVHSHFSYLKPDVAKKTM